MKLIVFGATGGTGKQVVEQALQGGHQVTAVVRSPTAFPLHHPHLTIFQGDVLQPAGFESAFQGAEALVSCLGTHKWKPTTGYSQGITNIIQAMNAAGVTRLVCLSSVGIEVPPRSSSLIKLVTNYILQPLLRHLYADMLQMEAVLRKSALKWTVIRPPQLTDKNFTGHYRTTINEPIKSPSKISRADLAQYIITHLTDERTFHAHVEISY
ncbi:NAD(P)-dependent oxidoreductase [Spirosoma jeollabukense]